MPPSDTGGPMRAAPDTFRHDAAATAAWNPDMALLVGRILLVAIFPITGYLKATGWAGTVGMMERYGLPVPVLTAALVTAIELVLPVLVILGLWARSALVGLIVFTAGATLIAHRFWEFEGAAWFPQLANFWKNVAMIGGMAVVAAIGPGRYAIRP